MSEIIMILGMSGSGKSSGIGSIPDLSIQGLNPKDTYLINVDGKRLPCSNANSWNTTNDPKNYFVGKDPKVIKSILSALKERKDIKNIVIDDAQYVFTNTFIEGIKDRKGMPLYTDLLYDVVSLLDLAKSLRDDQLVFLLSHIEEYEDGEDGGLRKRIKAIGKATHRYVSPEGKSTVVLYSEGRMKDGKLNKFLRTQGDGVKDSCKSPYGMFPSLEILNDLGLVEKLVRNFWKI